VAFFAKTITDTRRADIQALPSDDTGPGAFLGTDRDWAVFRNSLLDSPL